MDDKELRDMPLAQLRQLAGMQNNPAAQHELAWRYIDGAPGLNPNGVEATRYAQKSAAQEYIPGEMLYAQTLEMGLSGQSNIAAAFMLYAKVLCKGSTEIGELNTGRVRSQIDHYLGETNSFQQTSPDDITFGFKDQTKLEVTSTIHEEGKATAFFQAMTFLFKQNARSTKLLQHGEQKVVGINETDDQTIAGAREVMSEILGKEPKTVEWSPDKKKMTVTFGPNDVLTFERSGGPSNLKPRTLVI